MIDTIEESCTDKELRLLNITRIRLQELLTLDFQASGTDIEIPKEMTDDELVNTIAQYYEFEMVEKAISTGKTRTLRALSGAH